MLSELRVQPERRSARGLKADDVYSDKEGARYEPNSGVMPLLIHSSQMAIRETLEARLAYWRHVGCGVRTRRKDSSEALQRARYCQTRIYSQIRKG